MANSRGARLLKSVEMFRKNKPEYFDNHVVFNKIKLKSISNGTLKASFVVETSMCNAFNTLHGGYIAAIADVTSFYTILSNPEGRASFTTSLFVNYVAKAKLGEKVAVETTTARSGKTTIMETTLRNDQGSLLAKIVTAFISGKKEHQDEVKKVTKFDAYQE